MSELTDVLIDSGWLGLEDRASELLAALLVSADLLPVLAEVARRRVSTLTHPKTSKTKAASHSRPSRADALDGAMQRGAKLTFGWPTCDARPLEQWIGPRLLWWPRGTPEGRKVAWVSSRLGRAIDERPDWFAVLRSAVVKLDPERDVLLTASSTTVDRFLERAAILFGLRRLRVHLDEQHTLVDWLTRLRRQLERDCREPGDEPPDVELTPSDVFVSPIVLPSPPRGEGNSSPCDRDDHSIGDLPLRDRVLIAAADQVLSLQVRPKGNLHQLLRVRLSNSAWPTASVWLALGDALVPNEVASELQSLGAVGWWLFEADTSGIRMQESAVADASGVGPGALLTELPWPDGDYLVHWTRRRDGPWPEQPETDFLDHLLLSCDSLSHSTFAALSRIVRQRRLIASSAGIRGGAAVVSFSAKPLHELTQRRTFRAHRGRWDCEAYGLCIRRAWLQARGAKPVVYGDDELWPALPESERAFFQLKTTRSRRGAKAIDWSQEAEWRVPHNVDLSEADRDDVALFVPSTTEARQLEVISPWSVFALNDEAGVFSRRVNNSE